MVDPTMRDRQHLIKFRKSMKKFSGGIDNSFAVVEYSKVRFLYRSTGFAIETDFVASSFPAIWIWLFERRSNTPSSCTRSVRKCPPSKQNAHFEFLASATEDPRTAFRFLAYANQLDLAEKVLMDSLESVRLRITKLVNAEYDKMLNKRDEQRCRILVPKSRLIFGVCDPYDVLKEGECAVKITTDERGLPQALTNMEILVTRNPCLHPGDLQKFRVVAKPELAHLVDCIVFSTRGKRPAADLMSGGDLDGDTCEFTVPMIFFSLVFYRRGKLTYIYRLFVCWDSELIPEIISQPAEYPGAKEPIVFKPITDNDRLIYFAKYNNASLGRVKNLFLDWARIKGPMSAECQQLNRLFSSCVDGNPIKVPQVLESPPQPSPETPPFILDALHNAAKELILSRQNIKPNFD